MRLFKFFHCAKIHLQQLSLLKLYNNKRAEATTAPKTTTNWHIYEKQQSYTLYTSAFLYILQPFYHRREMNFFVVV